MVPISGCQTIARVVLQIAECLASIFSHADLDHLRSIKYSILPLAENILLQLALMPPLTEHPQHYELRPRATGTQRTYLNDIPTATDGTNHVPVNRHRVRRNEPIGAPEPTTQPRARARPPELLASTTQ